MPRETPLDLHFVETIVRPGSRAALPTAATGDAFLAGGTWLFSEPQPKLRRLIDLASLGWPALRETAAGDLEIAATCRLATLADTPHPLFRPCVAALWGSFKIHNAATVGGNLCLALPAGPMAALLTALDGTCLVWSPDGGEHRLAARDFVTGPRRHALRPGELLRAITLPRGALSRASALRQTSLTRFGRSAALLIGTSDASGFSLTVTASVRSPLRLDFAAMPSEAALAGALSRRLTEALLHDDVHGAAAWKRAMTLRLAEEIRETLAGA